MLSREENTPLINTERPVNYNPLAHRRPVNYNPNTHTPTIIDMSSSISENYIYNDGKRNYLYVRNYLTTTEIIIFYIKFIINTICIGFLLNFFIKYGYY